VRFQPSAWERETDLKCASLTPNSLRETWQVCYSILAAFACLSFTGCFFSVVTKVLMLACSLSTGIISIADNGARVNGIVHFGFFIAIIKTSSSSPCLVRVRECYTCELQVWTKYYNCQPDLAISSFCARTIATSFWDKCCFLTFVQHLEASFSFFMRDSAPCQRNSSAAGSRDARFYPTRSLVA